MARVTLRQVAAAAHVSVATASVALRGQPGVSDQTRALVLETAERMGYHPHAGARSLRQGYRPVVGVLMDPLLMQGDLDSDAQFVRRFVTGLGRQAAVQGASILLLDQDADASAVDALVWVRLGDDPSPPVVMPGGTPVTVVGVGDMPTTHAAVLRFDTSAMTTAVLDSLTSQGAESPALVRVRGRGSHLDAFEVAYRHWCQGANLQPGVWTYEPTEADARAAGAAVVAAGCDAAFVCTGRLRDLVLDGLARAHHAPGRSVRIAVIAANRPPGAPHQPIVCLRLDAGLSAERVMRAAVDAAAGTRTTEVIELPWSVSTD